MKFKIFEKIAAKAAPHLVKAKAASPHIAFGLGIAAVIGGTIYLCKQVHSLNDDPELKELEKAKETLDEVEQGIKEGKIEPNDTVNEQTIAKKRREISISGKALVAKKCALAAAIIVIGLGLTGCGHILLNNQKKDAILFGNTAMAMYNGLATRVKEELPKEDAAKLLFGKDHVFVDKDGQVKKVFADEEVKINNEDVPPWSTNYDILLNNESGIWSPSPTMTYNRILSTIGSLTNRLQMYGHLFVWEALEAFGYNKHMAMRVYGTEAGWVRDLPTGPADTREFSDFLDMIIDKTDRETQEFLVGKRTNVLLHLRPDGLVPDLLKRYDKAKRSGHWESRLGFTGVGVHA